jgi:hypothetical protein
MTRVGCEGVVADGRNIARRVEKGEGEAERLTRGTTGVGGPKAGNARDGGRASCWGR